MKEFQLKPNISSFLSGHILKTLTVYLVIFYFLATILNDNIIELSIILFLGISYMTISRIIRYKKEEYIFYEDRIVVKSGGIFSNRQTDLAIKNITHVSMERPFIYNKIFKTGHIGIGSVASAMVTINIQHINKVIDIYNHIENTMKNNQFSLKKTDLIQEERPNKIGVFLEVLKLSFSDLFLVLFITNIIIYSEYNIFKNVGNISFVSVILILGLIAKMAFAFLDLSLRKYVVYSDVITYTEGFFNKKDTYIPVENISDSVISQKFLQRILRIYCVFIRCKGTSQEIVFNNMKNGVLFEKNIENILFEYKKTKNEINNNIKNEEVKELNESSIVTGETDSHSKKASSNSETKVELNTTFSSEYKMDIGRTIFSSLVLVIFILNSSIMGIIFWENEDIRATLAIILIATFLAGGFIIVYSIIKASVTRFNIKSDSIKESYKLIRTYMHEFTCDKITEIVIKQNPIDKLFKTYSIIFKSIGSSDIVVFKNIKRNNDLENILAKIGVQKHELSYAPVINFNLIEMVKANIFSMLCYGCVLLLILVSAIFYIRVATVSLLIALIPFIIMYLYKYKFYKNIRLNIYNNYIYYKKGIIFFKEHYTLLNYVKDIATVKYPFSQNGRIKFNIAGEYIELNNANVLKSNFFEVSYVEDIPTKNYLLDIILDTMPNLERIKYIEENLEEFKQAPKFVVKEHIPTNLFLPILLSVVIFPLIPSLVISIPLIVLITKAKEYRFFDDRIVYKSGIIYKRQISIIYKRVDFINYEQKIVGKLFNTGKVLINTAGSSKPEIIISNIKDFKNIYLKLKDKYN